MDSLIEKYKKNPIHGDIYSINNLKVLLDDLMNEYLIKIGYKRKYLLLDIMNAIGILSILLASACCFMSMNYKYSQVCKLVTYCVILYFFINGISFLIQYFQDNKMAYGKMNIKTRIDDTSTYIILLYKKDGMAPLKYHKSVFDLYYDSGRLDHQLFLKDLEKFFLKE